MQGQLVKICKDKKIQELPLQVVVTVLNNQAVLHTTLRNFSIAEQELKWLISYCVNMKREDCDFLYNFVALHLSEVLLLHGKSKEAEKAFNFETLTSGRGIDLVGMFGGLHINVRIEAFEKRVLDLDHFNVASLLYKQGTILSLIGEVTSSAEKFKCSMDILQDIFGVKHPLLLKCYLSLGDLALKSERTDESYLYFQRAMESIETIYQVSFVSQLSSKYTEITKISNNFQGSKMRVDRVEGLVAEYGLALAVLLCELWSKPRENSHLLQRVGG
ncbi:hypothetical protein OS493_035832 [Desmophyllum pertusum]|uniref:Uncharacterized protein n=1 Tax=Desmophyllum pertusum TaxID=174260 RepID=A0A9W9YAR9_9CNID|nr:hypothetical protein OS493_035832 [Desmophyllum pertusum]